MVGDKKEQSDLENLFYESKMEVENKEMLEKISDYRKKRKTMALTLEKALKKQDFNTDQLERLANVGVSYSLEEFDSLFKYVDNLSKLEISRIVEKFEKNKDLSRDELLSELQELIKPYEKFKGLSDDLKDLVDRMKNTNMDFIEIFNRFNELLNQAEKAEKKLLPGQD
jgi:hypothetical protein